MGDLDAFRLGKTILLALRAAGEEHRSAAATLEDGLLLLCQGHHAFERAAKAQRLTQARDAMSRALGLILLVAGEPSQPALSWSETLETQAIPALSGLIRRAEQRRGRN